MSFIIFWVKRQYTWPSKGKRKRRKDERIRGDEEREK